ncbi:MAG: T9SS C-terminal target domain-containing protein, partial [Candidatus Latescibacterota bacterium]
CSDLGTRVPPGPPPAPTECAATDDRTDAVILTWQDNAENEMGYRVLRDGNLIAQLGANVETYEDHPTYGTHLYVVYAYGLTGASDECEDEGTRVLPPPPLPPSACDASDDRTDSVIVSWQDEADNESGFRIKRDGSLVGSVGANVERYRDVPPYGTYSYEVLAYNAGGESDPCGDEGTRQSPPPPPPPPNPPVDCDATDDRLDSIIVTWQDESENESGFRISRDHALIATVGADVEVYRDVPAVGTHVYSIRAYNLGGASDPCADEGTRLPSPPEAPGSCAATDDRVREIVVTWEDLSSDETAFHVYRDGEPIAELPAGAETHTDRVAAGDYEYAIRASNNGGFSGPCMAAGTALPGAVTWRVRPDGGGDFPTIQAAVDAAAPGDIVLLAPGVFRGEGNRGIDPHGKPITIRSETGHPAASAIDCEGVDRGFVLASEEGPGFALQAVTIRSGYHATDGGGAYIASSPSIRDCIFVGCISGGDGGALAVEGGTPEVSGCLFNKNSAGRGGAVFFEGASPSFDQCTFYGNESIDGGDAVYGGAFSSAAFAHAIVAASAGGGAIACGEGGAASFTCSDLFGNEGGDWTGCVAGQNGVAGNISLDPRFCGAESNSFRLHAQSPCLNPPCGRMGAYGRGCWGNVVSHQVGKDGEPGEASASDPGAFGEGPSVLLLPSPAHASVSILFSLPGAGGASVRVYDVAGRLVRSMGAPSSRGEVVWDGADDAGNAVAPGAYFVRIAGGERVETRRVVLIR